MFLKILNLRGESANVVGKGENYGYHHFLLCPQCFQKLSIPKSLKVGLCGNGISLFLASPGFYMTAVQVLDNTV